MGWKNRLILVFQREYGIILSLANSQKSSYLLAEQTQDDTHDDKHQYEPKLIKILMI